MMQARHLQTQLINIQLKNGLRVHMVCEWAWVSIPGERDLPTEVCKLVLSLGAQITRTGRYARTHTGKHAYVLLFAMALKQKQKRRCTVIAHTEEQSLTECIIYLTRIPNGPSVTKGRLNQVAVHNLDMHTCFQL